MKIKFLGTAAYDAIPSPFCNCDTCRRSRMLGGKNIRTRSQALINDDLLIDFNGDTVSHFLRYGIDDHKIKSCLITHSHSDHLYPEDIVVTQYATNPDTVNYYVGEDGYNKIKNAINLCDNPKLASKSINLNKVSPGDEFEENGYKILVLPARHDPLSSPVFYGIEKDGKKILYAHDTGYFLESANALLKPWGVFDLISLDCTGALVKGSLEGGHMALNVNIELIKNLKKSGNIGDRTKIVINHFSHNGCGTYDDIKKEADKYGLIVSYDGMEIEI